VSAAPFPKAPLLAVEVGMHTAMIRRIAAEERRGVAVTASDDKTVRVWSLADLRLLRTIRPPIGSGQEGRLFALALSPDGRTIAVGGWTGWEWDGKASVYLFDAETGRLTHRLDGLPNIVGYLAFSKDGGFLAAGLGGTGGVRIYRTSDYSLAAGDNDYEQAVLGIDFDPRGRMIASSLDKRVRLYDAQFARVASKPLPRSLTPVVVQFSPDGEKVAAGTYSPEIVLLSGRDLATLEQPSSRGLDEQIDLPGVVWSSDGRFLYAIGDHRRRAASPIFRWDMQARQAPARLSTSASLRVTGLVALSGERLIYSAEDPVVGVLSEEGRVLHEKRPGIADFRDIGQALRVSRDATTVEFAYDKGKGPIVHMSLLERKELQPGRARDSGMSAARTSMPGVVITDWKDHKGPQVNGKALALDREEYARCVDVAPDGRTIVLGGEWSVRAYDRNAQPLWVRPVAQVVWGVAISGDGRSVVAALSDGTLRWYRMADGQEYFALFAHRDGQWIAWVPQGYYYSSEQGDNFVGWHLNRTPDAGADFYRAVQFERVLYRYDIVSAQLADRAAGAHAHAGRFDIAHLAKIAPARVELKAVSVAGAGAGSRLQIAFSAAGETLPMHDYTVFVNNIPVTPSRERILAAGERFAFSRTVTADVPSREATVRVEVSNETSIGFAEQRVAVPQGAGTSAAARGNLYLLAVGVNAFPYLPPAWQLRYAAEDAESVARFFVGQKGARFDEVYVRVLSDRQKRAEGHALAEALEFIKAAGPRDTVVLFLASHGLLSPSGSYYFVPADARLEDVRRINSGQDPAGLVTWDRFFEALRSTAGRRLLIVDTCAGRGIEGNLDALWLKKRSASALFALMVSSKSDEASQEYDAGRHGLFTYALLRGLQTACEGACAKNVTLEKVFAFASPWVARNRPRRDLPQTPQLNAPVELRELVLAH
jgi:WD40 repeat protein